MKIIKSSNIQAQMLQTESDKCNICQISHLTCLF